MGTDRIEHGFIKILNLELDYEFEFEVETDAVI